MLPYFILKIEAAWTSETVVKGKGKVVPVLPPTEHHAMKAYWVSEGTAPPIL
jgi:hypothetical protein